MTFTLDTSGGVRLPRGPVCRNTLWSDLTPFAQGYIEALFASVAPVSYRHRYTKGVSGYCEKCHKIEHRPQGWAFSDLAPETLARIMEDCTAFLDDRECINDVSARMCGGQFWTNRNKGWADPKWGALTPFLGDDGKVYLREPSQ